MDTNEIVFKPSPKQAEAYDYLVDATTTQLGYGGAASGGKSYLGTFWLTSNCLSYPDTGWLLGRKDLINLRRTTLLTLFKLWREIGIDQSLYNYNQQNNIITFNNRSQIFLFDLAYQPSDPLYTRLGGLDLTGAFIDESNEVEEQAINIILTRLGRRNNDTYHLLPKLLECFNPDKGHIYQRFYKQWKEGTLPTYRKFVKALPTDNPYTTEDYLNQLRNSDKITKERLLLGNFEYDDDPGTLIRYDSIMDMFTNTVEFGEKYLTADIARLGQDRTVFMLWEGWKLYSIEVYGQQTLDVSANRIATLARDHKIPYSHILIDEDGVGGGVIDMLNGTRGFVANASPIVDTNLKTGERENFNNLKSQCSFRAAKLVNEHRVAIRCENEAGELLLSPAVKQSLVEELEQLKAKDVDKDGKKRVRPKDEVKEIIGRSPDLSDAFIMRAWFEYQRMSTGVAHQSTPSSMLPKPAGQRLINVINKTAHQSTPKPFYGRGRMGR